MIRSTEQPRHERSFLLALGVITLGGLLLRLRGLGSESFTADEMYSLICTRESASPADLISSWVARDGHPPLSYLIEYFWQRLFGTGVFALRLPFALMGAAAVWWTGRTAARLFSSGTGLAAAAAMAFLQLPLMYSQLTRPYATGVFFAALLVWAWVRVLTDKKPHIGWYAVFVLAAAGAAYSHFFSLFFAALVGASGLFFRAGRTWKYLLACVLAALLFVPYLGIFFGQLNTGGIGAASGGWLAVPTPSFFGEHIFVVFNRSYGLLWLSLALIAVSAVIFFRRRSKWQLFMLLWFTAPLLTGYFYSVMRNPVLQHSVLLFSLPALFMLLFSWLPPVHERLVNWSFPAVFAVTFAGYVTVWKPFHLTDHFGRLCEIAEVTRETEKQFGAANVACAFNVDFDYFLGYYWDQTGKPREVLSMMNNGDNELRTFKRQLEKTTGDYFVYGWSTRYSPPEMLLIIQARYPHLIRCERWFNSAVYVFSRNNMHKAIEGETPFSTNTSFTSAQNGWNAADEKFLHTDSASQTRYLLLDSTNQFSPSWKGNVQQLIQNADQRIDVAATIQLSDTNANAILVVQINRNGKQLFWNGRASRTQYLPEQAGQWQTVYYGWYPPDELKLNDEVIVYVYSENGLPVKVADVKVTGSKGHPGIYGVRNGFE
ncbi:MAG: glycosyltransferase family 39 protein [Bacteroidetes bacterium]|nr:glycosyltransferase family 39 protein [Bacteroidota bacterium]